MVAGSNGYRLSGPKRRKCVSQAPRQPQPRRLRARIGRLGALYHRRHGSLGNGDLRVAHDARPELELVGDDPAERLGRAADHFDAVRAQAFGDLRVLTAFVNAADSVAIASAGVLAGAIAPIQRYPS